jgi:hypothetical protein
MLRAGVNVRHEAFMMYIAGHPETTRRVQRHIYRQIKEQMPDAAEPDVLKLLVMSRLRTAIGPEYAPFGLMDAPEELEARLMKIVAKHADLESLIDAIIEDEGARHPTIPPSPGFEDACFRATQILRET